MSTATTIAKLLEALGNGCKTAGPLLPEPGPELCSAISALMMLGADIAKAGLDVPTNVYKARASLALELEAERRKEWEARIKARDTGAGPSGGQAA